MKKVLLSFVAALVLTLPVYIGIGKNEWVNDWFINGAGWDMFTPLFRLCNSVGITGDGGILITAMLTISFLISFVLVLVASAVVRRAKLRVSTRRG